QGAETISHAKLQEQPQRRGTGRSGRLFGISTGRPMRDIFLLISTALLLDGQVSYERILNAHSEPGNWLTYSGDYQAHAFSALDQINTSNVGRLKVAWIYQTGVIGHFETTPLVFDGVMYITE